MKILTPDNYFQDDEYFSVSTWKKYNKCEVHGKLGVYDSTPTDSMLVGSYVDAFVEGTLDKFIEEHPEIMSSRGTTKGELKSQYKNADLVCNFIQQDRILQQFLSGDKQTILTGEISGVPFKIKMDSYSKGIAINDLKCMATVRNRNGQLYNFISQYGYDVQLACYQNIVYQNTGELLPCFIVAVTKETPIDSVIVNIPQNYLDTALYSVSSTIEHYRDVRDGIIQPVGCGICSACISSRTETPIISFEDLIGDSL